MLGDSAELKERRLDVRERLREFGDDIRYAVRGLANRPGFTAIAVLTLGIGIGANTAIYSAVDALLLRSLPFAEPGRLLDIVQTSSDDGTAPWSYPKYAFFRDNQRSYAALAAHGSGQAILTGADPERVPVEEVTAQYLTTLGVRVARGRDFPAELDVARRCAARRPHQRRALATAVQRRSRRRRPVAEPEQPALGNRRRVAARVSRPVRSRRSTGSTSPPVPPKY